MQEVKENTETEGYVPNKKQDKTPETDLKKKRKISDIPDKESK